MSCHFMRFTSERLPAKGTVVPAENLQPLWCLLVALAIFTSPTRPVVVTAVAAVAVAATIVASKWQPTLHAVPEISKHVSNPSHKTNTSTRAVQDRPWPIIYG